MSQTSVETLSCNKCGAPLDVPASANYATCMYCKTSLIIKRTDSAVYTEVFSRIEGNTEQMVDDLRFMRVRGELELLDNEWNKQNVTVPGAVGI